MIRTLPTAGPLNGGLKPVGVRGLQDAPLSFVQGGRAPCFVKGGVTRTGSGGIVVDAAQATKGSGVLTLPGAGAAAMTAVSGDVSVSATSAPWSDNQKAKAVTLLYRVLVAMDPLGMARQFKIPRGLTGHFQKFGRVFLYEGVKTGPGKPEQLIKVVDSASFGDAANVLLGKALGGFSFGAELAFDFKDAIIQSVRENSFEEEVDFKVLWQRHVSRLVDWFNINRGRAYGYWLRDETERYVSSSIPAVRDDHDKAYMTALIMTLWAREGIKKRRHVQNLMRDLLKLLPEGGVKPFPYAELLSFLEDVSQRPAQGGQWKHFALPKGL